MKKNNNKIFDILNHAFFVILGIIMLYPLWYVLMFSLSDASNLSINSYYLLPRDFTLDSYRGVIRNKIIYSGFINSVIVTMGGTIISVFLTSITAYPLSRKNLPGRKYFFGFIIFTMIFYGGIIPTYLVVRSYGMIDTLWALIMPLSINVYNLLIMQKFFKNIPESIIESAYLEGCTDMGIFIRIVIKVSFPVLATISLFYAVDRWNDYFQSMLYINSRSKQPLQLVLRNLLVEDEAMKYAGVVEHSVSSESFKMASVIVTVLPIIAAYPFLQKYFVKGIMIGSVKG